MSAKKATRTRAPKSQGDAIDVRCNAFHKRKPLVWRYFEDYALKLIAAGHRRYSASAIMGVIRFQSDLRHDGTDSFKINNDYIPLYARRFNRLYPQHAGFLKTRKRPSKTRPPRRLPEFKPSDVVPDDDDQGGSP